MSEKVHPNLTLAWLFKLTEAECMKLLLVSSAGTGHRWCNTKEIKDKIQFCSKKKGQGHLYPVLTERAGKFYASSFT